MSNKGRTRLSEQNNLSTRSLFSQRSVCKGTEYGEVVTISRSGSIYGFKSNVYTNLQPDIQICALIVQSFTMSKLGLAQVRSDEEFCKWIRGYGWVGKQVYAAVVVVVLSLWLEGI